MKKSLKIAHVSAILAIIAALILAFAPAAHAFAEGERSLEDVRSETRALVALEIDEREREIESLSSLSEAEKQSFIARVGSAAREIYNSIDAAQTEEELQQILLFAVGSETQNGDLYEVFLDAQRRDDYVADAFADGSTIIAVVVLLAAAVAAETAIVVVAGRLRSRNRKNG